MTLCCAGGVLRLSRQVLFFVSLLPTPICALYTRSRLSFAPNQLIIALLIGSHLFLFFFLLFFYFFLPFFCAKQKQVYRLLRERQQRGMCRDYQSVIFFVVSFFFFSRLFVYCLSTITKSVGLTRPALDSRLSIGKALDRLDSPRRDC